jgi:6-phosphogluconolactonase
MAVTSRQGSGGGAPAFLSVDNTGEYLVVPNYAGGNVAVLPLQHGAGGFTLGPSQQVMEFGDQAKAHSAVFGPSADALFVPTLGLDKVQQLTFTNGKISQNGDPLTVPENEGPRHIAFHPSKNIAVLLNEGSADAECTVVLCNFDASTGRISKIETYDTLQSGTSSSNMYPAEVQFTEDGNHVLVTNRDASDEKKDGITVYKVNEGSLEFVQYAPVGHYPRSMIIVPHSDLVVTGNQRDNSLTVLRLDHDGHLTKIGQDIPIGQSPAFVGVFDLPSDCSSTVLV